MWLLLLLQKTVEMHKRVILVCIAYGDARELEFYNLDRRNSLHSHFWKVVSACLPHFDVYFAEFALLTKEFFDGRCSRKS